MLTTLIISAVSGAVGGNALGGILKKLNLGALGNTIVGAIGGGDMSAMISAVVAGGAGGGALTGILGMVKGMMSKGEQHQAPTTKGGSGAAKAPDHDLFCRFDRFSLEARRINPKLKGKH